LLPSIPQRLLQIDETTVGEHFSLVASDFCYYIWEYTAGQRYDFSPTNQLIANLKIKPTQIAVNPRRDHHKQQAISHSAAALRSLIQRTWVEQHGTFVPMPASKIPKHQDYDDRIYRLLQAAFAGFNADIRPMLELSQRFPGIPVIGIFVARCIRNNPFADFPVVAEN
jgi:hypothetical protein